MTQLVINIEDSSLIPSLKKILESINGVSIATLKKKTYENGMDEALDDIREGRVYTAENAKQMISDILGK